MPSNVFIAIGSNLNDPIRQVQNAMVRLGDLPKTTVEGCSSLYASSPQGPQDQDDYVNAVVRLRTELEPCDLLIELQDIENEFGRVKKRHWGERVIDLDIAFYDSLEFRSLEPDLLIPHPRSIERDFVLKPILEICPDFTHPNGTLLNQYLGSCENFCSKIIQ